MKFYKIRHIAVLINPSLRMLSIMMVSSYSVSALATCVKAPDFYAASWNINVGTLAIQRDTPVGTVIYQRNLDSVQTGKEVMRCTNGLDPQHYNMLMGTAVPGFANVFSTNIDGVGVRVRSRGGVAFGTTWVWGSAGPLTFNGAPYNFELIKTGAIRGGNIRTGELFSWTTDLTGGGVLTPLTGAFTGGTVTNVACSVSNTVINVPMGNVNRNVFTGVASEGNQVQFSIPLDCDAGTRVNFKIEATADNSGAQGVMALNSPNDSTTAKGVGIKLNYNDTPLRFGTVVPAGTSVGAGAFNIPLTANYYQTAATVEPGRADGTATFTMTYN